MKRIGIITIVKCNNFGAELQACATVLTLQGLGYDAEIIDYLYFKNPKHKVTDSSKPIAPQSFKAGVINYLKYEVAIKILYGIVPLLSSKLRVRNKRFCDFHKHNTKMSQTYASMDDLYNKCEKYDVYIVGSDQTWNPNTESNLAPYFLQFAPHGAKKVSYASSFGMTYIPKFAEELYKKWLNSFDHISCRESAGVDIVRQLTGREASLALDPTLLLNREQWMKIKGSEIRVEDRYVLIYEVRPTAYIQRIAKEYARKNKIPVYRLCLQAVGNKKNDGIINIEDAGPADFVHLFANASLVVTNSFHGTAFACNFGRNFNVVLSRSNKKNSRMTSLLDKLELSDRIIWEEDEFPALYAQKYDVEKTQLLLASERKKSIDYLINAIDN